jgi:hypothetical protein
MPRHLGCRNGRKSPSILLTISSCLQCAKERIYKMQRFSKCLRWRLLHVCRLELRLDLIRSPWQCMHENKIFFCFLLWHDIKNCYHSKIMIKLDNGAQSRYFSSPLCLSIWSFKFFVLYDL